MPDHRNKDVKGLSADKMAGKSIYGHDEEAGSHDKAEFQKGNQKPTNYDCILKQLNITMRNMLWKI